MSISRRSRLPGRPGDVALHALSLAAAALGVLVVAGIAYKVYDLASPAVDEFGLGFVTGSDWNPVTNQFGARDLIYGTVVSSFGALVLAVPLSVTIALFLAELAPRALLGPVGALVELLAAVPSVVLGLWGILVLGPWLARDVEPRLGDVLGWFPLFSGDPSPAGLLNAMLILTIMVVPIVASITRELFLAVPLDLKEGAYALGATRWEMMRSVLIPQVGAGIFAAVILGLGRALGEAIAVSQVIGGTAAIHASLFQPADTLAGRLASQYQGAATSLQAAALAYLALILLVISLVTNVFARVVVGRVERRRPGRT